MGFIEENNQKRRDAEAEKVENKKKRQALKELPIPDTSSVEGVIRWHFEQSIHLLNLMSRDSAEKRLRGLNAAVDSFAKLRRLSKDTESLEEMKQELDELKNELKRQAFAQAVN